MLWILVFLGAAVVSCFVVGRLEQRIVRKVVVKSVKKLGIKTKSLEVRVGWAWPLSKDLSITAVVKDPADTDKMTAVVANVSSWLDGRWG